MRNIRMEKDIILYYLFSPLIELESCLRIS